MGSMSLIDIYCEDERCDSGVFDLEMEGRVTYKTSQSQLVCWAFTETHQYMGLVSR
jgi:hypothetical protein